MRSALLGRLLVLNALVGCGPTGPSAEFPSDTIVVDGSLFWREQTASIHMLRLPHGDARTIASPPATGACIGQLLTNSTRIFWTDCMGYLWSVSRNGDQAQKSDIRTGYRFAVDDENVYYTSQQGIVLKQSLIAIQQPTALTTSALSILSIAVHDGFVYVGGAAGSPVEPVPPVGIFKVPVGGGGDAQLAINDTFEPDQLLADMTRLYWATGGDAVREAQLDGTNLNSLDGRGGYYLRLSNQRLFWYTGESIISSALDGSDQIAHLSSKEHLLVGPAVEPNVLHVWES
jgi:hypothetical protein